ncbi:Ethanolamine ammonia-lyase light chain [Granulicella rosea]|uniref:Ethanolamine ammonia-lyase small subunit n=1 Tax=Granulicella rosea TaxID=474952 RepID=A0A239KVP5_9BACT|nr:ethanolamine ammonia-lyase subunit EutC [Granulicella rosea]SNT22447.1 Ethanolamine ammonia-lyase light chain [Granulicella rosea]
MTTPNEKPLQDLPQTPVILSGAKDPCLVSMDRTGSDLGNREAPHISNEAATHPEAKLDLRTLTPARVGLARTGSSLTTTDVLDLALAHAEARDAVHATLSLPTFPEEIERRGWLVGAVKSAAPDRTTYLRRPELGRQLSPASAEYLESWISLPNDPEIVIVIADGLSALAVDRHAIPLLDALQPLLPDWWAIPVIVAEQARVALGDPIGQILKARLSIVLIGERPGLSSPDSLGAYITWQPRPGRTDAERNCISNIRAQGLDYATAAERIAYLCREAARLQLSGTAIKDDPRLQLP